MKRTKNMAKVDNLCMREKREGLIQVVNSIKTYEYKYGFLVDIIDKGDMWDIWLYHKDHGIKEFMFGLYKEYYEDYEDLLETVYVSLKVEGYIKGYLETLDDLERVFLEKLHLNE